MGTGRLVFHRVEKSFPGGPPVLRGLSADIPLSGLTFVVGQSGGGKSVLCKLAVGLLRPDAGTVALDGEDVPSLGRAALHALRRRFPYVVQGPALLDWLTAAQNVALADERASPEQVQAALEKADAGALSGLRPEALGPGAQKRVAMARALLLGPRFLLLDEPTTGLDNRAADAVNHVLTSLRDGGLGALVVSHDYRALRAAADRVLLVAAGTVAFQGPRDEFLASALPDVRGLLEHADG
ncbi:MAG TPA: ATP-binding cassette domain-containing protein [Myxococcales bacterium]|nr:ATP-binding cassette domain-containing protein [Myxococcales bacterium]